MKKEVFAVGDLIEMMCSACDLEQNHVIQTVTKQG